MNINWKVRFQNKVWLTGFIAAIVAFVYNMLERFEIVPAVSEAMVLQAAQAVLLLLTSIGVLVDPTTKGINDSERALSYKEPD